MPLAIISNEEEHLYAAPPESEAGRDLASALLHFIRAEHAQENRVLVNSGLLNLDLLALRYMVQAARDERMLGHKYLVTMLGTSSANVTNIVDRLVKRGYVERVSHPSDRRAHYLRATSSAVELVDSVIGEHHSAIVDAINQLGDAQAEAAAGSLRRITERIHESTSKRE